MTSESAHATNEIYFGASPMDDWRERTFMLGVGGKPIDITTCTDPDWIDDLRIIVIDSPKPRRRMRWFL